MYQDIIPFRGWIRFLCLDRPHFVYPFTCWWTFGLFPLFVAIVNNATMNIHVQVFVWSYVSVLLEMYLREKGIAESPVFFNNTCVGACVCVRMRAWVRRSQGRAPLPGFKDGAGSLVSAMQCGEWRQRLLSHWCWVARKEYRTRVVAVICGRWPIVIWVIYMKCDLILWS